MSTSLAHRSTTPSLIAIITTGIAVGIAAAHCYTLHTGVLLPVAWLAAALVVSLPLCLLRRPHMGIVMAATLVGGIIDTMQWQHIRSATIPTGEAIYQVVVDSEPRHHERSTTMRATILQHEAPALCTQLTVLRDSTIRRGHHLLIRGSLQPIRPAIRPYYHHDTWLWHQGVVCRAFAPHHRVLPHPQPMPTLRQRLLSLLRSSALSDNGEAVTEAMLLGSKTRLDTSVRAAYSDAGGSHLLALSGLHLSILTAVLFLLFGPHLHLHLLRLVVILPLVWFYVYLADAPPSLVRAATMLSVWLAADAVGRHTEGRDTLFFTILVMLLVRPFWLFDTGFQLSVTAVYGLCAMPLVAQNYGITWRPRHAVIRYTLGLIVTSTAATIATAPLVAYTFHRLPLWGWLMSAAYIPLTTIVMTLAPIMTLCLAFNIAATPLATLADSVLQLQLTIMRHTDATLSPLYPSLLTTAIAYALLLCFVHHRRVPMYVAAVSLIISMTADRFIPITPTIYFDHGSVTIRHSRTTIHRLPIARDTTYYRHGLYAYGGFTLLRIDDNEWQQTRRAHPFVVDYLWICRGYKGDITPLMSIVTPRAVLLDATLPLHRQRRYERECDSLSLSRISADHTHQTLACHPSTP